MFVSIPHLCVTYMLHIYQQPQPHHRIQYHEHHYNILTCIIIVVILLSLDGFNSCDTYQNHIPVLFNHHIISNINHIFPLYIIMNRTSKRSNCVSTKTKWSHKSCISAKYSGHKTNISLLN